MSSKLRSLVLLVSVLFLSGGGSITANAQSSENPLLFLPMVLSREAQGTPTATPTPTVTSSVTAVPTSTITPTPTDTPAPTSTPSGPENFVAVESIFVDEYNPSANYYPLTSGISVGYLYGDRDGLVKFDLSAIPSGTHIVSAYLVMNYQLYSGTGTRPGFTITTHRISSVWSEQSVTWNTMPAYAESYGQTSFYQYGPTGFDVTGLAQAWINGTYPNFGILLEGYPSRDVNHAAIFCVPTGGIWGCSGLTGYPYLHIVY